MAGWTAFQIVSTALTTATAAHSASTAHHARKDVENVQRGTLLGRLQAERSKKKAKQVQEGLLTDRARERRSGGFGSTIAAGARPLGTSNSGGKSLLG